jgi:hypothetical protein
VRGYLGKLEANVSEAVFRHPPRRVLFLGRFLRSRFNLADWTGTVHLNLRIRGKAKWAGGTPASRWILRDQEQNRSSTDQFRGRGR